MSTSTSDHTADMQCIGNKRDKFYVTSEYLDAIDELSISPERSEETLYKIVTTSSPDPQVRSMQTRMKEEALYKLAEIYTLQRQQDKLSNLLTVIRPFFDEVTKPRTAKIIRGVIDIVCEKIETMRRESIAKGHDPESDGVISVSFVITLVKDSAEWARQEKRSFLRQRLETRLAQLLVDTSQYAEALALTSSLLRQVKKVDDKPIMVDLYLIESMLYYKLHNYAKSRGALTLARSTASGFYCPPLITAQVEMQAGILTAQDKDFVTAESYFHEATDNYLITGFVEKAIVAFKYTLLCKIMNHEAHEVAGMIQSRLTPLHQVSAQTSITTTTAEGTTTTKSPSNQIIAGLSKFATSNELTALKEFAQIYLERDLSSFDTILLKYPVELGKDPFLVANIDQLRDNLLESNIHKLVAPYSRIDIPYLARKLSLPEKDIENKMNQMILDKCISATIDHHYGDIILMPHTEQNQLLQTMTQVVDNLEGVIEQLSKRVDSLSA